MKTWKMILPVVILACSCQRYLEAGEKGNYSTYVNRAEMAIIENDPGRALACYRKAFRYKNPGFASEHFNAFKLAIQVKDIDFAFSNAMQLAKMGYCIGFFEQYPVLKEHPGKWGELASLAQSELPVNLEYRNTLWDMFQEEQTARLEGKPRPEIRAIDSLNLLKFRRLIRQYGFPSEDVIGIECTDNLRGIRPPAYFIMLLHFAQAEFQGVDSLLLEALEGQKLSPYYYAFFEVHFSQRGRYMPSPVIRVGDDFYVERISEARLKAVNENRRAIGLPSVEEHIKKIKFAYRNPNNGYRLYTSVDAIFDVPQEVIDAHFVKIDI